jgi:two-component system, cell cycle sensor histidine kinase and response regulator CckA
MDLNENVADAVSMLARVLGEHIEIEVDLGPDLPVLRADPTQVHQVLLNLALNARDAMSGGGELRIATGRVAASDPSVPATVAPSPGGYVVLTVADTGCGMEPDVRERIFDPFFTTKEVGAGSGLGLASVYGIVKQSGGEITVESEVGAGTSFTIYLPALATG